MSTQEYRLHSDHPEDLDDGRVLEPGEYVDLSEEDASQARATSLIEDGRLVQVDSGNPEATDAAKKLARQEKVDLKSVTPTGSRGEITVDDVKQLVESQKGGQS